jgi:hypothetical protein
MSRIAARTTSSKLTLALVVSSPAMTTWSLLTRVSQATREKRSWAKHASRTESEMLSATLSGWPSPTDSEEKV